MIKIIIVLKDITIDDIRSYDKQLIYALSQLTEKDIQNFCLFIQKLHRYAQFSKIFFEELDELFSPGEISTPEEEK